MNAVEQNAYVEAVQRQRTEWNREAAALEVAVSTQLAKMGDRAIQHWMQRGCHLEKAIEEARNDMMQVAKDVALLARDEFNELAAERLTGRKVGW